jgi:hypothetical protein
VFYFSKISVYVIFTLGHTRPTSFEVSQPEFGSYLYVFLVFSIYPLLHIALLVFSLFNYGLCAISSMINSTKRSSYCYVINWSRNPKQFTQPEGFPSLQTAAHFLYQHWVNSTQCAPRKTWAQITCLSTLFSNTYSLFSSFRIRHQDLHAYMCVQSADLHSYDVDNIHLKEKKTAFG